MVSQYFKVTSLEGQENIVVCMVMAGTGQIHYKVLEVIPARPGILGIPSQGSFSV